MNRCKQCDKETDNAKFCSKSCSASYNNTGIRRHGKGPGECLNCSHPLNRSDKKYCNNKCQKNHEFEKRITSWLNGSLEFPGKASLKKYLRSIKNCCWKCEISTWNNQPIVLELEHVDGNADNNKKENLKLLCPNCHSQTETYKSKNIGNGRHFRRERYKKGKSY